MKSRFTYRQSQVMTTIEVLVSLVLGVALWFSGSLWFAWGFLFWAVLSLLTHHFRDYADQPDNKEK